MESELPLNQRVKAARRAKRWSQSDVAARVGCKQSAVSMFENGRVGALADDKIEAICSLLGVALAAAAGVPVAAPLLAPIAALAFCPTYDCPSNLPYMVGTQVLLLPARQRDSSPSGGHCRYCGERLERGCPECGTPVADGACCGSCGSTYVMTPELGTDAATWVVAQQQRVRMIRPQAEVFAP